VTRGSPEGRKWAGGGNGGQASPQQEYWCRPPPTASPRRRLGAPTLEHSPPPFNMAAAEAEGCGPAVLEKLEETHPGLQHTLLPQPPLGADADAKSCRCHSYPSPAAPLTSERGPGGGQLEVGGPKRHDAA